jgi:hypothetical protein
VGMDVHGTPECGLASEGAIPRGRADGSKAEGGKHPAARRARGRARRAGRCDVATRGNESDWPDLKRENSKKLNTSALSDE